MKIIARSYTIPNVFALKGVSGFCRRSRLLTLSLFSGLASFTKRLRFRNTNTRGLIIRRLALVSSSFLLFPFTIYNSTVSKQSMTTNTKLRDMKCSIDNQMPKVATHLKTNAKKNALMEERFGTIERENRMLLEKMSYIMRFKGGIDNKNESLQYGRSLNKDRRKRELQKITKQNQLILSRIQESQPTYDHLTWAEEARVNQQFMTNICEYKPANGGTGRVLGDGADLEDEENF